jgi:PhnB protein
MMKLNPYLNFNGTADKAIQLYERALGAKVEAVMRFGDVADMDIAPENKNLVMHAMLQIGEGVLMISDCPPGQPVEIGENVQVTLHFDDTAEMAKKFDALAVGGKVRQPLEDMFWGARFGMLTDAYGIPWMFNCETKKA